MRQFDLGIKGLKKTNTFKSIPTGVLFKHTLNLHLKYGIDRHTRGPWGRLVYKGD